MPRPQDVPDGDTLRLLVNLGTGVGKAIRLHEMTCPCRQEKTSSQPSRLPFSGQSIPEDTLIAIVERMSTEEDYTVYAASAEHGYPVELLQLELARVKGRYQQELLSRSNPRRGASY